MIHYGHYTKGLCLFNLISVAKPDLQLPFILQYGHLLSWNVFSLLHKTKKSCVLNESTVHCKAFLELLFFMVRICCAQFENTLATTQFILS